MLGAFLAEKEGFEPPDLLQSSVFKTDAIDHSATSLGRVTTLLTHKKGFSSAETAFCRKKETGVLLFPACYGSSKVVPRRFCYQMDSSYSSL